MSHSGIVDVVTGTGSESYPAPYNYHHSHHDEHSSSGSHIQTIPPFIPAFHHLSPSPQMHTSEGSRNSPDVPTFLTRSSLPSQDVSCPTMTPSLRLLDIEIWRRFCDANNEMIVTKSGR